MLPVSVDADFDEGLPEEEADQTAAPAPAKAALSQLGCNLDAPDTCVTLKTRPQLTLYLCPLQALPVSVDADFDEGLPEEEAEQTAAPAPAEVTRSQLGCNVDAPEVQATASGLGLEDAPQDDGLSNDVQQSAASKLCSVCGEKADAKWLVCGCGARSHIECTAKRFLQVNIVLYHPEQYFRFTLSCCKCALCGIKRALLDVLHPTAIHDLPAWYSTTPHRQGS